MPQMKAEFKKFATFWSENLAKGKRQLYLGLLIIADTFGDARFNLISEDIRTYFFKELHKLIPVDCAFQYLGLVMGKTLNASQFFNIIPNAPEAEIHSC